MEKQGSMDRLSNLPLPTLHHILCFLSYKEAIQTCVLSKSWRYMGPTRSKIEFRERWFNRNKEKFLSVFDSTLQWYHDQRLPIQEFIVWMSAIDYDSVQLLQKWIPIVVSKNTGLKTFRLSLKSQEFTYFSLPSIVFKAESLQNLYLERCRFNRSSIDNVTLKNLKTLHLKRALTGDMAFALIVSSCPLIENLSLSGCDGLRTIDLNNLRYLKYFSFDDLCEWHKERGEISIEIGAPTIKTISIEGCQNWLHQNKYFPNLKSLFLNRVQLTSGSFQFFFDIYMPSLECLTLDSCYGFDKIDLFLSDSFKHLVIKNLKSDFMEAAIDAPHIVTFVYEGDIPEWAIAIQTTSREWKSNIILSSHSDLDNHAFSWFCKLKELLKALRQSEITLKLSLNSRGNQQHIEEYSPALLAANVRYKPVVVEDLSLGGYFSSSSFPHFVNCLFRICHPRRMGQILHSSGQSEPEGKDKDLTQFFLEFILMDRETRQYFWPPDLEDISLEEFDEGIKLRSQLKWRELN